MTPEVALDGPVDEGEGVHNAEQPGEPVADLGESELGYDALIGDLHTWIASCLDLSEAMAQKQPSRELALVLTKLEEAEMWLIKLFPGTSEGGEE